MLLPDSGAGSHRSLLHLVVSGVVGLSAACAGPAFAAKKPATGEPCTAASGWVGCPDIPVRLEPLLVAGQGLALGIPTALLFTALEPGGPEHLVVAEKDGLVSAWDLATGSKKSWLNLEGVASVNPERGLLGLALHPQFASGDHRFFTYHTAPRTAEANAECDRLPWGKTKDLGPICAKGEELGCGGASVVTEWTVYPRSEDPQATVVGREILRRNQPGEGHNAGHVLFGPDGMLYVSFGDGGAQMDPCARGQNSSLPYSALLRLDLAAADLVPQDNPFVGQAGHEPLIWARGFRNPWRMAFTPAGVEGVPADVLILGDTGQSRYEEVDVVVRGGNYGWGVREGTLLHPDKGDAPSDPGFINPVFQYGSGRGKAAPTGGYAIVGGLVATTGPLAGMYVFGDNVTTVLQALDLRAVDLTAPATWNGASKAHLLAGGKVAAATFGRDAAGVVYVGSSNGKVFRLVAGP